MERHFQSASPRSWHSWPRTGLQLAERGAVTYSQEEIARIDAYLHSDKATVRKITSQRHNPILTMSGARTRGSNPLRQDAIGRKKHGRGLGISSPASGMPRYGP